MPRQDARLGDGERMALVFQHTHDRDVLVGAHAFSRARPLRRRPTIPTGRTFTSQVGQIIDGVGPATGTMVRSRCFRISTGASRDTRGISPKINSSATGRPSTVTVVLGNDSTIFLSRSFSLGCLFMCKRDSLTPCACVLRPPPRRYQRR